MGTVKRKRGRYYQLEVVRKAGMRGLRTENDLASGVLRHILQSVQLPNLHSRGTGQDLRVPPNDQYHQHYPTTSYADYTHISSLPHQLRGLHLSPSGDDFGFTDPLLGGSAGEKVLEFLRESVCAQFGEDQRMALYAMSFVDSRKYGTGERT